MKNDRELLFLSFFTFVTITSWIFFELIKTAKTSTVTAQVQQIITPLTTTFDVDTLNILNRKNP